MGHKPVSNHRQNGLALSKYLPVVEPHDGESGALQDQGSLAIRFNCSRFKVLTAIQFNDQ
jgi:hypothetical protein